jgi:hypothetical protein
LPRTSLGQLRTLSGGKPTGFKFCLGHPWGWFTIVKAMLATGITPIFIVVDGAEGGTAAALTSKRFLRSHLERLQTLGHRRHGFVFAQQSAAVRYRQVNEHLIVGVTATD